MPQPHLEEVEDVMQSYEDGNNEHDRDDSGSKSPPEGGIERRNTDGLDVPRPKRIACVVCRKRKLRCDGIKPSCGTCSRLGHNCAYDEIRRKSGPKRGYVKQLEARLAQVETLLTTQERSVKSTGSRPAPVSNNSDFSPQTDLLNNFDGGADDGMTFSIPNRNQSDMDIFPGDADGFQNVNNQGMGDGPAMMQGLDLGNMMPNEPMTWEMIGLGLDEPLPTQDVIDDLLVSILLNSCDLY
jgi:Fungal Zn(2)-Cys(6) binuclear cluster domain